MVQTEEYCETCVFFLSGMCRRFPPQLVEYNGGWTSGFPVVNNKGWCGEYEKQLGRRRTS